MSLIAARIPLPRSGPSVLAVGAFLKNTICVTRDDAAYLSQVHGDLGTPDAIAAFEHSVAGMVAELGVSPVCAAHDLHPDFHSTRFAQSLTIPALAVQHHHAHAAALAVEHGMDQPILGLSLDGFGLGPDNQSWGGELLLCQGAEYQRLGHLALLPQPGGDRAAREPWRMAAAALHVLGRGDEIASRWGEYPPAAMLDQIMVKGLNSPLTSSAGRLFDAACGLLNIHPLSEFEGQAPMAMESMVTAPTVLADGYRIHDGVLDFAPLLAHLADMSDTIRAANLFHGTLIAGFARWCESAAQHCNIRHVALGGGCFFNKVLRVGLHDALLAAGLQPLCTQTLSPGDPGLSVGQAWIALQSLR